MEMNRGDILNQTNLKEIKENRSAGRNTFHSSAVNLRFQIIISIIGIGHVRLHDTR